MLSLDSMVALFSQITVPRFSLFQVSRCFLWWRWWWLFLFILHQPDLWASLVVQSIKNLPAMLQTVRVLFFFSIWIPFFSFSALIAVAQTSKTMLNSSGESGHPCLVPDFRGNAFNFSPLRIMFAVGLSYIAFIESGE